MKAKFEIARDTKMSDEEFKVLLLSYPIYLVAKADGTFDQNEIDLMSTILYNFLYSIYGDNINDNGYDNLISNFIDDFEFLSKNEIEFKNDFLTELTNFDISVKKSINDLLIEIAEISGGVDINEKNMIDFISTNYLH